MNKAIFLDRDGTIIKDRGVVRSQKDVEFYGSTLDSLQQLQRSFLLFVISNQPGIAEGVVTAKEVDAVHRFIRGQLRANGILIQEFYYCPHRKEDRCRCRKPNTFFVEQALKKYSLQMNDSFVMGDHPSDMELAFNIHAHGMYLLTGHGKKHRKDLRKEICSTMTVCKNLQSAAHMILKRTGSDSRIRFPKFLRR